MYPTWFFRKSPPSLAADSPPARAPRVMAHWAPPTEPAKVYQNVLRSEVWAGR